MMIHGDCIWGTSRACGIGPKTVKGEDYRENYRFRGSMGLIRSSNSIVHVSHVSLTEPHDLLTPSSKDVMCTRVLYGF